MRPRAYNALKGRESMKKTGYTYRNKSKTPPKPRWTVWDILFLQICLCLLLGLGVWLNVGDLRLWLNDALNAPPLKLPQVEQEQLQEAVETFLNQYIYEEPQGMGGLYPLAELPFSAAEAPEGMSFRQVAAEQELCTPLSGSITSHFGYREHPITGKPDFHTGVDIAALEGTAIHCAADGKVTEAGWSDIYGNYLVVSHSENFQTKYAHCSRLIAQQGDVLRRGERIALVGSTGVSTGPHLHFECIVEELRCDPLWLLPL